jgi:hypothetical protein
MASTLTIRVRRRICPLAASSSLCDRTFRVVIVDEPARALVGPSDLSNALVLLAPVLEQARAALTGLHCCAATAPGPLVPIGAEVISHGQYGCGVWPARRACAR